MPENWKQKPSMNEVTSQDAEKAIRRVIGVPAKGWTPIFRRKVGDRRHKDTIFSLAMMGCFLSSPLMWWFIPIWFVFLLAGGVDRNAHSEWGGWSRLGFMGEMRARFAEPFVVFGIGIVTAQFDEIFALFCFIGAVSMFMVAAVEWQDMNKLWRDMRDAGEHMAWMGRVRRGGWRR